MFVVILLNNELIKGQSMITTICWVIQIISSLILILLVMIHSPKGDGIAGIGGASHVFASQKNAESGLNKLTMWVAIVFFVSSFIAGFNLFS